MEGRGRKSSASLTVVSSNPTQAFNRPEPPSDLTREQAEEWVAVVNRLPADWFPRETHPVLASYVRHIVAARHVAQLIVKLEKAETVDVDEYDQLLRIQERESRAIVACARSMRLTQQTTYLPTKKKPGPVDNPWDDD
jgi:hypothetical protein